MRILLDACVPRRLRRHLRSADVRTASEMGWGDLDNGDLLDAMEDHFDALLTVDKGLPHQQQVSHRAFGVLIVRTRSNRLDDLLAVLPEIELALDRLAPGESIVIEAAPGLRKEGRGPR